MLNIKRLAKSKFARNVFLVATGTAGAQIINMAFAPLVTRLYGAEAFGLLGTFTATLAVLTPIVALAYPIAIVLPKKEDEAKSIAKLSVYIAASISIFLLVFIYILGEHLAALLNAESIASYLLYIPVALFFLSLQQIMQQWLIRKKQFKVIARVAVSQSLILNSTKAGLGVYHPVGAVLIILTTLGSALYSLQLWLGSRRWSEPKDRINSPLKKQINLREMAAQYKDFPFYRAPQLLINALSQSLPVLMLATYFGVATAGFYTLSRSILAVPANLIGKSVTDVFYPRINEAVHKKENVSKLITKATLVLILLGIIPFSIIILFGPWVFEFVFGHGWEKAGEYAQWLSLWLYVSLCARPAISSIATLGIQRAFLIFEIIMLAGRFFSLYFSFLFFKDVIYLIATLSIVNLCVYILLILWVLHVSKKHHKAEK